MQLEYFSVILLFLKQEFFDSRVIYMEYQLQFYEMAATMIKINILTLVRFIYYLRFQKVLSYNHHFASVVVVIGKLFPHIFSSDTNGHILKKVDKNVSKDKMHKISVQMFDPLTHDCHVLLQNIKVKPLPSLQVYLNTTKYKDDPPSSD